MAAKNCERCKRRATELLPRSIEHLAKLAVLDHGDDLKLHEVAPHQRELRERPDVVAFKQIETAAEIRSRPPAEQFWHLSGIDRRLPLIARLPRRALWCPTSKRR